MRRRGASDLTVRPKNLVPHHITSVCLHCPVVQQATTVSTIRQFFWAIFTGCGPCRAHALARRKRGGA